MNNVALYTYRHCKRTIEYVNKQYFAKFVYRRVRLTDTFAEPLLPLLFSFFGWLVFAVLVLFVVLELFVVVELFAVLDLLVVVRFTPVRPVVFLVLLLALSASLAAFIES